MVYGVLLYGLLFVLCCKCVFMRALLRDIVRFAFLCVFVFVCVCVLCLVSLHAVCELSCDDVWCSMCGCVCVFVFRVCAVCLRVIV